MVKIFHDIFERDTDILESFQGPPDGLDGATVVYAMYQYEDYQGSALVLFEKDGKLFQVDGCHCSCNGLEGQWRPEETSWDAVKMMDGYEGLAEVVAHHELENAARI